MAQRRDGQRNRLKVLEAAGAIMREQGADAPLEVIAERAGVTRTTIYRNFDNRFELYVAVLNREVDLIKQALDEDGNASLTEVMRRLAELMDVYDKFGNSLPYLTGFEEADCRLENFHTLVVEPLKIAKAAGEVREDLTESDIILACRMMVSGWRLDLEANRDTAMARRFNLVMRGLLPD